VSRLLFVAVITLPQIAAAQDERAIVAVAGHAAVNSRAYEY
jgi:hypothetical protein